MKRLFVVILIPVLLTSCSKTLPEVPKTTTETTAEETHITIETTIYQEDEPNYPELEYTISEPTYAKEEGNTLDMVFYRDGEPIYGKITRPKGQNKDPFKTIIISNGLYAPLGRYSNKAVSYSEKGYAVVEFQFQNGTPPDSYDDPEYLGDFIFEQILDLSAVMDSLEYIPYIDTSNVYLYGHSMGGLVTSYVGTFRQDRVRGLILVDPSFYATDLMEFEKEQTVTTDIYPVLSGCKIPVLIITGTEGSFGEDPDFFNDALEALPNCRIVVIEGANHSMEGNAGEQVVERSVEVMREWG